MQPETQSGGAKWMLWLGWALTALCSAVFVMSAVMKFVQPAGMEKDFHDRFGWDMSVAAGLGVVELVCALIYLCPPTSVLGAILLTGYLGGAVATHLRIYDNFVPPIILGVLVWLGVFLRDSRLRAIVPWRT